MEETYCARTASWEALDALDPQRLRRGRKPGVLAPPVSTGARRQRYDVIVIGSGVGGCVTAGWLAHRGARVLVLEKNPVLGGILASYWRDGFKIDVGSHLIAHGAKGPIAFALRGIGAKAPRFLTHELPVRSRGMFEIDAPSSRLGLLPVALEAARRLRLPARDARRLARMMFQVFTLTDGELRAWDRRTLHEFVAEHTTHPGAYFLFSFLASIFFVLPPWAVSAGESIRSLRSLLSAYSLSYVEGGMDSIAHALLGPVVSAGGEIVTRSTVVAITPDGDELVVATADGAEHRAPYVACNLAPSDMLALYRGDVPDDYAARVAAVEPSGCAHQLKVALRRPLVPEGCIIGGVSLSGLSLEDLSLGLMERAVDSIAVGRVSDPLAVYAPVPTNFDPSLGPEGTQLIVASIYGPTRDAPIDAPERWREASLRALATIVPGLLDELLFAEFTSVPNVGLWMGKRSRAAISNGQQPGQVGEDRLPVHTPMRGLFLCGDGAGGRGIGTELAARSGMEAARAIDRVRVAA